MKRLLLSVLAILALLPGARAQQAVYQVPPGTTITTTNNGVITAPPVIDAVNFINYGTFDISTIFSTFGVVDNFGFLLTPVPFETFDTLNYTNYGTMVGQNGWRFDFNSNLTGRRGMASSFANLNGGLIQAVDPFAVGYYVGGLCAQSSVDPSYLLIYATNIVSGGGTASSDASLIVGVNGVMDIAGKSVDLGHSGLQVTPAWNEASFTTVGSATNFIPDIGIYDVYWAQSGFSDAYALNSRGLWDGVTANSLGVPVAQGAAPFGIPGFSMLNPFADSYINVGGFLPVTVTNIVGDPTNIISISVDTVLLRSNVVKGAVFVGVPAGFSVQTGFGAFGSFPANNRFESIEVILSTGITNIVTGQVDPAGVFFDDELASDTRLRGNALNVLYCSSPQTFRPANYAVDRGLVGVGFPGNNGYPDPDFLVNSGNFDPSILFDSVTNFVLTDGDFAAYASYLDNLASRQPAVPNATATNLPGRIQIRGDSLNLESTRIRGEGRIQIDTPHLISSSNAVIDCENLSFNIGSKTDHLNVQNLVPPSQTVSRLKGNIRAWSAVWSNEVTVILQNYTITNDIVTNIVDTVTNVTTNVLAISTPITNILGVGYHTLMLDARLLTTVAPVYVYKLNTHSADVTVNDFMTLIESLSIDGRSFTLNGSITIPGNYPPNPLTGLVPPVPVLRNWVAANAPNLLYFTNNGALSIANEGHFGDDRSPYSKFINNGTLSAAGLAVSSDYFENSGTMIAQGAVFLKGGTGKLQNGGITSGTDTKFTFPDLKLIGYQIDAGFGPLTFEVSDSLSDAGPGSGNLFRLRDGMNLALKPQIGDLLGTTIETRAVGNSVVIHTWAAEDRGPTPAGYSNNVAIGVLTLIQTNSNARLVFSGTGTQNGLYVDLLDLSTFTSQQSLLNQFRINPNLVIYFAAAKLGFTPPDVGGIPQEPEEYLDGLYNGHLRWVQTYAGANSGQSVLVDNQTMFVNRALFNSQLIDSNGDSIPNSGQTNVFLTAPIVVNVNGNGSVSPDYNGSPLLLNGVYSLSATPAKGAVFTGWTGAIESASPVLVFTNTGDLEFTANFEFQLTPGTYSGLFYQSDGVQLYQSGSFTAKTTKSGTYSGMVMMGKQKFPFSGEDDESGFSIPASGLAMELQFDSDHITGTIGDGENWVADLQADRAIYGKTNKAPFAGRYTIAFRGSGDLTNTSLPFGDGYGTVLVDDAGKIKLSGSLADGTKITQTTTVSGSSLWPLYVPLYNGGGQILGWMSFDSTAEQDVGGLYNWIKDPDDAAKLYPDGFNFTTNAVGSIYNAKQVPVTGFLGGSTFLSGGNLGSDLASQFLVSTNNKVTVLGTNNLKLTIKASQGLFKGSMVNPATGKPVNFIGAILQKQILGAGYFLGTNQSGRVILQP